MNCHARWPLLRRVLTGVFLLLVGWMLWRYAKLVDWHEVVAAIAGYPGWRLALAALASAVAYGCYCSFDLLARGYTGHALGTARVLVIAFVCYAFNLNLGAVVGGIGFRYRLYSQVGLDTATIARVVAFAIAGNWSGFLLLGGLALTLNPLPLPAAWNIASGGLRLAGLVMLVAEAAWLGLCAFSPRRRWSVRGHPVELPSWPTALAQLALACASWLSIAAILYLLLPPGPSYATVAGTMLLSVLANLVIRVPANLGVLEAVFIGVLGAQSGVPQVLAAVLTYRALFHIGPLLLALATYVLLEAQLRRRR